MDYLTAGAFLFVALLQIATLATAHRKYGPSKRARKRAELARLGWGYAEQLGGTGKQKLTHAIEAAGRLDQADNGKRDFSDAELRIEIEAQLQAR
jgi:hypothetical protein